MQVGVIGLGNIGGHVAANLVTDGHDVVVFDVDARARRRRSRAHAVRVGGRGRRGQRGDGAVAARRRPSCAAVADEWATTAPSGAVLVDLSTNSPEVVRELGARLDGDRPPPGRGAAHRRARSARRTACSRSWSAATTTPSPACSRCSSRSGRAFVHLGPLGLGNTMKLVNSLIAFTTTWVSLEGLSLAAKSGIPVQQAVEVLRTNGVANFYLDRMVENIDTRNGAHAVRARRWRPRTPASSSRPGAPLGVPTPAGAAVLAGAAWARSRAASATTTGATSSPSPNARATSSSTGTPTLPTEVASPNALTRRATQPRVGVSRRCRGRRRRRGGRATAAGTPA